MLKVLEPIWTEKPETARRLRQRMATVFDWAIAEGHYPHANPVQGPKFALPKVATSDAHYAALHWRELPAFTKKLADRDGTSARCLEFIILTAARSGEARGAVWLEIDFEGKSWNIPGDRMKRGKSHRVPLSSEALAVLEGERGMDPVFCFPSPRRAKGGSGHPRCAWRRSVLVVAVGLMGQEPRQSGNERGAGLDRGSSLHIGQNRRLCVAMPMFR